MLVDKILGSIEFRFSLQHDTTIKFNFSVIIQVKAKKSYKIALPEGDPL